MTFLWVFSLFFFKHRQTQINKIKIIVIIPNIFYYEDSSKSDVWLFKDDILSYGAWLTYGVLLSYGVWLTYGVLLTYGVSLTYGYWLSSDYGLSYDDGISNEQ